MNLAIAKLNDEVLLIKPWTLPEGWCWATLEDVADGPQYGWTASATATGKVRLLRTTDISSGKVDWTTVPFCSESPPDVEKYLLRDGDIVISRAGSVGKKLSNIEAAASSLRFISHSLSAASGWQLSKLFSSDARILGANWRKIGRYCDPEREWKQTEERSSSTRAPS